MGATVCKWSAIVYICFFCVIHYRVLFCSALLCVDVFFFFLGGGVVPGFPSLWMGCATGWVQVRGLMTIVLAPWNCYVRAAETANVMYLVCGGLLEDQEEVNDEEIQSMLSVHLKPLIPQLRRFGFRRFTFVSMRKDELPRFFTYRLRLDFQEDSIYRHIEPGLLGVFFVCCLLLLLALFSLSSPSSLLLFP